ncbi:hypothetical protein [Kitasatospora sp. NPDC097691]|uniref:hypothetical protein n=1 Tax=Kitasatospora sp. NPDC097691 TaxID=3157231 RepID=UPI003331CE8B
MTEGHSRDDRVLDALARAPDLDGLTGAYAEGHPDRILHLRLRPLGEAGRCAEGIAQATALTEREFELARLLERDSRPQEALALLRSSAHYRADVDLADLLITQGRPAEALACVPTTADQRKQDTPPSSRCAPPRGCRGGCGARLGSRAGW